MESGEYRRLFNKKCGTRHVIHQSRANYMQFMGSQDVGKRCAPTITIFTFKVLQFLENCKKSIAYLIIL